jgi:hypothetical protein
MTKVKGIFIVLGRSLAAFHLDICTLIIPLAFYCNPPVKAKTEFFLLSLF